MTDELTYDAVQVARHKALLELWQMSTMAELVADLGLLHQMLTFREYQQRAALPAGKASVEPFARVCREPDHSD